MRLIRVDGIWRDALYAVLAAGVVGLYVWRGGGGFPLDDSWIHQVYGRNLGQYGEWAFLRGEPSAASTAPLYTVLLAAGYALGISYEVWTHLLGALALAGGGMIAARLADRVYTRDRRVPLAAGLAVVLAWHLIWSAAAGMETMLFGTLTLAIMLLAWREVDNDNSRTGDVLLRGGIFGVVAGMATLTRPEGVLLAGLAGMALLADHPRGWRDVIYWSIGAAIGGGLTLLPYVALNLHLNDTLLPATSDAKYAQHKVLLELSYLKRLANMTIPVLVGGQVFLLPGFVYYGLRMMRRARFRWSYLLPLVWTVALIALYAARLPAPYQHGRYVIPALPALLVCSIVGMGWLLAAGASSAFGRVTTRTLAIGAAFTFVYFGVVLGSAAYKTDVAIIDEEMVTTAQWIAETLPEDDLLAVHDIGAVGYFAPRPILDVAGLINPEVAPIVNDADALWALLEARNAQYLMAFPDQIPGDRVDDPRLCFVYESPGRTSFRQGGAKMRIYRLAYDGNCSQS